MNASHANLINALVLIATSAWAYFASGTASFTALIPAGFGIVLFACTPGVKTGNKITACIAIMLTLIVMIALMMPLRGALARGDLMAPVRAGLMLSTSTAAFITLVMSFNQMRKS